MMGQMTLGQFIGCAVCSVAAMAIYWMISR